MACHLPPPYCPHQLFASPVYYGADLGTQCVPYPQESPFEAALDRFSFEMQKMQRLIHKDNKRLYRQQAEILAKLNLKRGLQRTKMVHNLY